jgi:hypothetical protein
VNYAQDYALEPKVHEENGIYYVSGGIGQSERDILQKVEKDYNLKLIFALSQGPYLSHVPVQIRSARDKVLLETVSEGPWLYVGMPPGQYTVIATMYGQRKQQVVQVRESGQVDLQFSWNASQEPS